MTNVLTQVDNIELDEHQIAALTKKISEVAIDLVDSTVRLSLVKNTALTKGDVDIDATCQIIMADIESWGGFQPYSSNLAPDSNRKYISAFMIASNYANGLADTVFGRLEDYFRTEDTDLSNTIREYISTTIDDLFLEYAPEWASVNLDFMKFGEVTIVLDEHYTEPLSKILNRMNRISGSCEVGKIDEARGTFTVTLKNGSFSIGETGSVSFCMIGDDHAEHTFSIPKPYLISVEPDNEANETLHFWPMSLVLEKGCLENIRCTLLEIHGQYSEDTHFSADDASYVPEGYGCLTVERGDFKIVGDPKSPREIHLFTQAASGSILKIGEYDPSIFRSINVEDKESWPVGTSTNHDEMPLVKEAPAIPKPPQEESSDEVGKLPDYFHNSGAMSTIVEMIVPPLLNAFISAGKLNKDDSAKLNDYIKQIDTRIEELRNSDDLLEGIRLQSLLKAVANSDWEDIEIDLSVIEVEEIKVDFSEVEVMEPTNEDQAEEEASSDKEITKKEEGRLNVLLTIFSRAREKFFQKEGFDQELQRLINAKRDRFNWISKESPVVNELKDLIALRKKITESGWKVS